ncbi:Ribosomal RNA-processing protein 8 [Choanephora cucurbitarum]|uniref:Ribosomal RNA-processing protein 8 n=1 Tax=Choanephora cucurbitarum TaxID=101091 RepID=A0A1C7N1N3_9FUNG|nr:Ribosomal RNA-processing protein 8 [Choanephora cucurbitarum]
MQPLFEASGWALPKSIAQQVPPNEKKKIKNAVQTTKESQATKEADQLQAELAKLNDGPKKQQDKKQKNKRPLEETKRQKANEGSVQKKQKNVIQNKQKDVIQNKQKADQKKKLQALLSKNNNVEKNQKSKPEQTKPAHSGPSKTKPAQTKPAIDEGLTPLQRKMKEKLSGARFRWLNEQLYTTPGNKSFSLFQEKPELFDEYHEGFRHQVESWPVNPVDIIIGQLKSMPKNTVIADLGCGDAMIAQSLKKHNVLSFDLIAKNELVTACDISKLPLEPESVDVAVFSLSLMGTNYLDFLKEAHRVLKVGGELKIAEVVSRFSDLDAFITLLEELGYDFMDKEDDNKMFVMLYFTKRPNYNEEVDQEMLAGLSKTQIRSLKKGAGITQSNTKLQKKAQSLLKPCLYKKR